MGDWLETQYNTDRIQKLEGITSAKIGQTIKRPKRLSSTTDIMSIQGSTNKIRFRFNGVQNKEETTYRELNDELHNAFGTQNNLAIESETTIHKTPDMLNISADDIYQDHKKCGSYTKFLMSKGFINLTSPYHMMKTELLQTWNKSWCKHLRGVLAGSKPYTLEGSQADFIYNRTKKRYILATQEELEKLCVKLTTSFISKDIAIPSNDNVMVGGIKLPISIYTLKHRPYKQISMSYDDLTMQNILI
jgi:hypothetical protein